MDVDEVLRDVGEFGKYQKLLVFLVCVPCTWPMSFSNFGQLIMINEDAPSGDQSAGNGSTCVGGFNTTILNNWNGESGQDFSICESSYRNTLFQIIVGLAGMIGGLVAGFFDDRFGRKLSYFIMLAIDIVFGIASAFATNFWTWLILRFIVSITTSILLYVPYILAVELVGPKYRSDISVYSNISMSVGFMLVSFAGAIFKNWRSLALVSSAPFLLFFLFWQVMPESPRWYLAHGKFDQAVEVLRKLSTVNGRQLTDEHVKELQAYFLSQKLESEESAPQYTIADLFKYKSTRMITFFVAISSLTCWSVNAGLYYNIYHLAGDRYVNFALTGIVQLPGYIVSWPFMNYFGRRSFLCWSMIISGAACTTTRIFEGNDHMILVLFLIGIMGSSVAILVLGLFTAELYPTPVRSIGLYFASIMGFVGVTIIPTLNSVNSGTNLALMILGMISIIGGGSSFLLKETKDEHLQDNVNMATEKKS